MLDLLVTNGFVEVIDLKVIRLTSVMWILTMFSTRMGTVTCQLRLRWFMQIFAGMQCRKSKLSFYPRQQQ